MLRHAVVFFALLMFSSNAFPTTTLPTVKVVGFRVSGWVTLYEGSGCDVFFSVPSRTEPLPGEVSLPPEDSDIMELLCSGDSTTRETAVWMAYRTVMQARYSARLVQLLADDKNNQGREFMVVFNNGSVGKYYRSDSGFFDSHGMFETAAPDCEA
ncbi:hypothetical protein [Vulcaniibacterium gelatinicum]|uniref:hypothetical protein n=1 Tax=Vulcaniibacterium gelatinicum TaxID=2598725 RepID=UPI0011C9BA4B|nr:hypothetical protein [Vulcaniibacterium gelatinicum]